MGRVRQATRDVVKSEVSWLGKLAKSLFIFLFFFYLQLQDRAQESVMWLCHNVTMVWQRVTVGHMTRVTWGPWESKRIATVVKCISSREMSENSIEFSLSNSEQRDSWLNSSHWTLDADMRSNPQTGSPYIQKSDSLCTRPEHHMLLPIVLHIVVPLC